MTRDKADYVDLELKNGAVALRANTRRLALMATYGRWGDSAVIDGRCGRGSR